MPSTQESLHLMKQTAEAQQVLGKFAREIVAFITIEFITHSF